MKRKCKPFIAIFIIFSTAALCADLRHAVDPRGKIEQIVGEGNFAWNIDQQKRNDCLDEAKENGEDFTITDSKWIVTGGNQDWVFTRITRMGEGNDSTIKKERFRITIMKADGVWITRTEYRFRVEKNPKDDTFDVSDKDKGGKFTTRCRITGKKIILAANSRKEGLIYRITQNDGILHVSLITTQDLKDWTMDYKKH